MPLHELVDTIEPRGAQRVRNGEADASRNGGRELDRLLVLPALQKTIGDPRTERIAGASGIHGIDRVRLVGPA